MICKCPLGETLTTIPKVSCPETFGQVQKVAFTRLTYTTTVEGVTTTIRNSFSSPTDLIDKLASWTAKEAAADGSKIVISPYIQAPTAEAGAAITFGGGNDTLGGVEEIIGREPTPFTGVIRKCPQSIIKILKELQCESYGDNLGIYIFDENGAIGAIQDQSTATTYYPIPIRSLFVGDKTLGGLEQPDSNAISWSFLPNWSDDLAIVAPDDFNPLTDL